MKIIAIKTQEEMDALPRIFKEFTRIEIRAEKNVRIIVRYARDNSSIDACENSSVIACENSSVIARENSSVIARGNSSVIACERSSVDAWDNSSIDAWDNSSVIARDNSSVDAWERSVIHNKSKGSNLRAGDNTTIYKHKDPKSLEAEPTVNVIENKDFITPSFQTWLERGWVVADGIRQKLISKKSQGEVTIYTTQDFKKEAFYVAQKGDKFAHAKTIKEAVNDLRYKISGRDTSRFKNWKLDDKKPLDELVEAYRVITGACGEGTKMWCEGKALKDEYTVKEAIELTRGSYASDSFSQFFEGR